MDARTVRLKVGKTVFEVLVTEGMLSQYRRGVVTDISEVIASDEIWASASAGRRANESEIYSAFNTHDKDVVLKDILTRGVSQEGTTDREQMIATKRSEVAYYIARHYFGFGYDTSSDKTDIIEEELKKLNVKIDPKLDTRRQVTLIVPKLEKSFPNMAEMDRSEAVVTVDPDYARAAARTVRQYGEVLRETYGPKYKAELAIDESNTYGWGKRSGKLDQLLQALSDATNNNFELQSLHDQQNVQGKVHEARGVVDIKKKEKKEKRRDARRRAKIASQNNWFSRGSESAFDHEMGAES